MRFLKRAGLAQVMLDVVDQRLEMQLLAFQRLSCFVERAPKFAQHMRIRFLVRTGMVVRIDEFIGLFDDVMCSL